MTATTSSISAHRLQILGAALLFSTGGAAIKASSLNAWQVASFRSGIAALALALVVPGWRRRWSPGILVVGLAYAATMILFVGANKLTTAANTIFLQSTAPVYLLLLGPWVLAERVRRSDLAFIALLAVGMTFFFVGVDPPQRTAPDPFLGNLLGACAGMTWALTLLGLRWLGRDEGARGRAASGPAVVAGNLIACLVCLPFALPVNSAVAADVPIMLYLGVFQIGLAYVWLTRGVRRVPALETGLLLLLEPVSSSVWAWAVHGERPGPWSLAGCLMILSATVIQTLRRR